MSRDSGVHAGGGSGGGPDVLVVRGLEKAYGGTPVLRGVSLTAAAGEIVSVVGPNGAGKTSLLECVEGLRPTGAGTVEILGHRPQEGPWVYHALFGAQLQESSLPARLRVGELMSLFAAVHENPHDVDDLLARTGLLEQRRAYYGRLSGGQKRRVMLAAALLGRPPLVLLDEPTSGLDPHARLAVWSLLRQCARSGGCVVFTTHDMAEAEEYSDRLYLLDRGVTVLEGRPDALLRDAGLATRVSVPAGVGVAEWLRTVPGNVEVRMFEQTVYAFGDGGYPGQVLAELDRARGRSGALEGVALVAREQVVVAPARVEDLYLMITGNRYDP